MMWIILLVVILDFVYGQTDRCHTTCTAQYKPACGSDGITYSNICRLSTAICYARLKGQQISFSHYGTCSQHVTHLPPVHSTYHCGDFCDEEVGLVCGTDGKTYHNQCFLQQAICEASKTGHSLHIAHYGECTGLEVNCPHNCDDHLDPVCSTGNVTFKNPCWLNLYGCKYANIASISDRYHLAHEGTCDGTDPEQSATKMDCSNYMAKGSVAVEGIAGHLWNCPSREYDYLCGADHRTYTGPCSYCRSMDAKHKLETGNINYLYHTDLNNGKSIVAVHSRHKPKIKKNYYNMRSLHVFCEQCRENTPEKAKI